MSDLINGACPTCGATRGAVTQVVDLDETGRMAAPTSTATTPERSLVAVAICPASATAPHTSGLAFDYSQWSGEEQWVCDYFHTPRDTIHELAMLVSRGVRPMSLVQSWSGRKTEDVERVFVVLRDIAAQWRVLPFAEIDLNDVVYYGFDAEPWVVDLFRYALTSKSAEPHSHHITGLLLGYCPRAIREHEHLTESRVQRHER